MKKFTLLFLLLIALCPQGLYAQTDIKASAAWKPLLTYDPILEIWPAGNGDTWVTTKNYERLIGISSAEIVLVGEDGSIKAQVEVKPSKMLEKQIMVTFHGKDEKLMLITADIDKKTEVITFFSWTIDESGLPGNKREIWKLTSNDKLDVLDNDFFVEHSPDKSKIMLANHAGIQFGVLDSELNLLWEGTFDKERLKLVKMMTVTNDGNVGLLTFTNQNAVIVTSSQEILLTCVYADKSKSVTVPITAPPKGGVSLDRMYLGSNSEENLFLVALSAITSNSKKDNYATFTLINSETKEKVKKIWDAPESLAAILENPNIHITANGHILVLLAGGQFQYSSLTVNTSQMVIDIDKELNMSVKAIFAPLQTTLRADLAAFFLTSNGFSTFVTRDDAHKGEVSIKEVTIKDKLAKQAQYNIVRYDYSAASDQTFSASSETLPEKVVLANAVSENLVHNGRYYTIGNKADMWVLLSWAE